MSEMLPIRISGAVFLYFLRTNNGFRIDFILLPILGLAFFALQLDRGNIANALTSTITKDLGVTTNQINAGSSILSAGIVVLEIPSNILLQKVH